MLGAPTQFNFGEPGAGFTPRDAQYLSQAEVEACAGVPKEDREVWQVTVKRLRCFGPGQTPELKNQPVRPYCVLVACLHPTGRLLAKHVVTPPELAPSSPVVLAQIVRSILEPGSEGVPPGVTVPPAHRPGKITFPDPELAAACAKSLAAVGIETSVLSEAPAMGQLVRQLSAMFVQRRIGLAGPAGDKPGLLSRRGVTPELARAFFRLAAEFTRRNPWMRIVERQLVRVRGEPLEEPLPSSVPGETCPPPGVAWVGIVGNRSFVERQRAAQAGQRPPLPQRGMTLFFKRYDAEYRVLCTVGQPPGADGDDGPLARKERPPPPAAVANPLDMVCARPTCGKTPADVGGELQRCARCKEAYYCGRECQSEDWKRHGGDCKRATVPEPGPGGHWGAKEVVLLLEGPLELPFDDHELMDALAFSPPDMGAHPVALTFGRDGRPTRPSRDDLVWLMRGMATVIAMIDEMPRHLVSVVPMPAEEDLSLARTTNEEHWYDAAGDGPAPLVHVRTDPILTREEHTRLQEMMRKDEEEQRARAAAAAASGGSSSDGDESDAAGVGGGSSSSSSSGAGAAPGASPKTGSAGAAAAAPAAAAADELAFLSAENLAAAADRAGKAAAASGGADGAAAEGSCVVM